MMKKLFGSKQEEVKEPPMPKLNEMSNDQLKEVQKDFKKKLNKEAREIDRQILKINMQQKKSQSDLEKEIKKGQSADKFIKQTYAKQVLQCVKQKNNYYQNKAKVQNLGYTIDSYMSNVKLAKVMNQSSDIMKQVNQLMNVKEIGLAMQDMQKEMMKMGMIQEMMDDAMENLNQDVEIDNEKEVDAIINIVEKQVADKQINKQQPILNLDNQQIQQQQQQQQMPDQDDMEKRLQELMNM